MNDSRISVFEFGVELEEVTTDEYKKRKEEGASEEELKKLWAAVKPEDIKYRIDIPANRYDLLCLEGFSIAVRAYLLKDNPPTYKVNPPQLTLNVAPSTQQIRPFVVAGILRNLTLDEASEKSLRELQEKLHNNICRKRTLVAIGAHDLDTIQAPFSYEALPPPEINFVPLKKTEVLNGADLVKLYSTDERLKGYLPIIKDSPIYPVIYDSKRTVLSLPPIINGEHSKVTLKTKNLFIECTATDLTKAHIVLNTIIASFSKYCNPPFEAEAVNVVYKDHQYVTPQLGSRELVVDVAEMNKGIGINEPAEKMVTYLKKMGIVAKVVEDGKKLSCSVPATRSDIFHACDILEDIAIGYGFNNIVRTIPKTPSVGRQLPINSFTDLLRYEVSEAGYTEVLTYALLSKDENYSCVRKPEDGKAIVLSNPQTVEFQIVRTSLIPGLLKVVSHNLGKRLPFKIFEVTDVAFKSDTTDVGAINERHLVALYSNRSAGFEVIHGLLDRIMAALDVEFNPQTGYSLKQTNDPTFLGGYGADIHYLGKKVGVLGVVHPAVLESFPPAGITYPCSVLEINIEPFA